MSHSSKLLKSYAFYIVCAFGVSLTIKANVGVSCFNSMTLAVSEAVNIKVGTITMFAHLIFLLFYMYLTRFSQRKKYIIQTLSLLMFGTCINFFTYTVLAKLQVDYYVLRILLMTLGTVITASGAGMIVSYDAITFPVEGVCLVLSERGKHSFTFMRYGVDVIAIAVSLSMTLFFSLELFIREGTIISMILFSFTAGWIKQWRLDRAMAEEKRISGAV